MKITSKEEAKTGRDKIIWCIKQLLPLKYASTYRENGCRMKCEWRMWMGHCFSKRYTNLQALTMGKTDEKTDEKKCDTCRHDPGNLAECNQSCIPHLSKWEQCEETSNDQLARLKDGQLCTIKTNGDDYGSAYYHDGRFYQIYDDDSSVWLCEYFHATLINKANFNILEHLEGEK